MQIFDTAQSCDLSLLLSGGVVCFYNSLCSLDLVNSEIWFLHLQSSIAYFPLSYSFHFSPTYFHIATYTKIFFATICLPLYFLFLVSLCSDSHSNKILSPCSSILPILRPIIVFLLSPSLLHFLFPFQFLSFSHFPSIEPFIFLPWLCDCIYWPTTLLLAVIFFCFRP